MLMLIHGRQKHFQTDLLSLPADIYLLGTGGLTNKDLFSCSGCHYESKHSSESCNIKF